MHSSNHKVESDRQPLLAPPSWRARAVILSVTLFVSVVTGRLDAAEKRPVYIYEDTRRLVALVEDAARLVEQKGEAAYAEFKIKGSR